MANTVSYSASMRTRKTNSASNAKSSAASQEYYENTYNYVGIVHFAGMALSGKVITGISLRVVAAQAGYGTGHTKTVYVRKANYQSASQSGITGLGYCGDALGTFTGAFYGNTSTYTLSGDLLNNLAAYIAEGNNTICLYNPNPVKSSQGYSTNYLQWSECTITVTYEEAASKPSLSKTSFEMGTAVTIYTNRQSSIATHTIRYSFFSANGTIATGVTASCTWTPPVSLAEQIPNATSGWGTILCDTYVNGNLVSTNTCAFQLTVPASVAPSISNVAFSEATSGIADRFGGYVRTRSKLSVSITAAGTQGSSISAYRTSIDSVTYSGSSFTSNTLNTAGNLTMTVTVTHKALMDAVADHDAGKEPAEPAEPAEPSEPFIARRVRIVCDGGTVNIRVGNGTQYDRITAAKDGSTFGWVATAENGWHAVVVNGRVGWVSGKYAERV